MKKALFAALFMVLGAGLMWLYQNNLSININLGKSPSPIPTVNQPAENILPTVAVAGPEILPTEEVPPVSDVDLLRAAFAQKYGKNVADVTVTVNKNTGVYASGGVKFGGEIGGGWFLAYKQGESWIIVADGNGTVMCDSIAPYNFPTDMVPECWDEATSKIITR